MPGQLVQGGAIAGTIAGSAGSPATINYAGHVGVGMLVVLTLYDASGGAWAPTSITDSAGNTYSSVLGATGADFIASGHVVCRYPALFVYDCYLSHAVSAATVLSVALSASATFNINGSQFAGLTGAAHVRAITTNIGPTVSWSGALGVQGLNRGLSTASATVGPGGVGLAGIVYPNSYDAGGTHVEAVLGVQSLYNVGGAHDVPDVGLPGNVYQYADGHMLYKAGSGPFGDYITDTVNTIISSPVYAAVVGRAFGVSYDAASVPTSSVPAAFTLAAHATVGDSTAQAGGKRLDMRFESDGATFDAGGGSGVCLDGSSITFDPAWSDTTPNPAALASNMVSTPSGPQQWTQFFSWWRGLIADATLDDPAQTGSAALIDFTIDVTPTEAAAIQQACGGSPVATLGHEIAIVGIGEVVIPAGNGLVGANETIAPLTGDLLVDGAVTATNVALDSTVLGHELGFRLWNHHAVPTFMPGFQVEDILAEWNTMTVDVKIAVSIYFRAPYPADPSLPTDTWDQPSEPADGPPITGDGGGGGGGGGGAIPGVTVRGSLAGGAGTGGELSQP